MSKIRTFSKGNLKKQLLCITICSVLVPTVILGILIYHISTVLIIDKVSRTNLDTTIQLKEHIDTIATDIRETSMFILQDEQLQLLASRKDISSESYLQLKNQIEYKLLQLCGSKSHMDSIYIELFNGDIVKNSVYGIKREKEQHLAFDADEIRVLKKERGRSVWDFRISEDGKGMISCSRYLKNLSNQTTGIGYMRCVVNMDSLNRLYSRISGLEGGNIYLLDRKCRVVSTSDSSVLGLQKCKMCQISDLRSPVTLRTGSKKNQILISTCFLDSSDCRVIYTIPVEKILKENQIIKDISVLGMIFGTALAGLFTFIFSAKIFSRIASLQQIMEHTSAENLDARAPISKRGDEIDRLAGSFNQLSDRVTQTRKELYDSKIEQQRAEISALQSQLNPHFLYNTLDFIYWECAMKKTEDAAELVLALSNLFRMTLNNTENTCTLGKELEFVKSYLKIMQLEKEDKIRFVFSVDPSVKELRVLKMILQPLCENIFQHAFVTKQKGTVMIRILIEGHDLVYHVQDNGDGADELYIEYLINECSGSKGMALRNIKNRLNLAYGERAIFRFSSIPGIGTTIEIRQPLC